MIFSRSFAATAAACSSDCFSACVPQLQHDLLQLFICLCAAAAAYFDGPPLSWTCGGMQKVYQVAYEKVGCTSLLWQVCVGSVRTMPAVL